MTTDTADELLMHGLEGRYVPVPAHAVPDIRFVVPGRNQGRAVQVAYSRGLPADARGNHEADEGDPYARTIAADGAVTYKVIARACVITEACTVLPFGSLRWALAYIAHIDPYRQAYLVSHAEDKYVTPDRATRRLAAVADALQ